MKKVLVGLSGGVDSAIAAYLLKQQGYDVTCAFMRNWDSMAEDDFAGNPTINDPVCPQEADWKDAESVANMLGLPLLRIDFIRNTGMTSLRHSCRSTDVAVRQIRIFSVIVTSNLILL